jgi:hypothetical protein
LSIGAPRRLRPADLLLAGLVVVLTLLDALGLLKLALVYPPLVDLEIPLRAAERWLTGGSPYLASSFAEPPGYGLPFLYAPPTLPFFAGLALLPRPLVGAAWLAACVAAAVFGTRRLGVPWLALPFVLAWPPFAQALLGGNVQVFMFAAFVAVFWRRTDEPWHPVEGDVATTRHPVRTGTLAAFIPAMKISVPHAWVAVVGRNPRAAAAGAAVVVAVVVATLPIVGVTLWADWLQQIRRALDPAWVNGGYRLFPDLPVLVTGAAWLASVLACLVAPRRRLGTWAGLLAVLGAASLHVFALLFVFPALLVIRREIALFAAILIAAGSILGGAGWLLWAGAVVAALGVALGLRWPSLLEPDRQTPGAETAD